MRVAGPGPPAGDRRGLGGEHDARRAPSPAQRGTRGDVGEHGDGDEQRRRSPRRRRRRWPPTPRPSRAGAGRRAARRRRRRARRRRPPTAAAGRRAGPARRARGTGASSRWRTSGASTATGPPSLPLRSPRATATATADAEHGRAVVEDVGDLAGVAGSSVTSPLSHSDDAAADERGEVRRGRRPRTTPARRAGAPAGSAAAPARRSTCGDERYPAASPHIWRDRRNRFWARTRLGFATIRAQSWRRRRAPILHGRGRRGGAAVLLAAGARRARRRRRPRSSPGCSRRSVAGAAQLVAAVDDAALWLAFLVAATCDGRQPLLLRGRRLRAVPAVLVPAHRHVPAGRDPARRGDPPRPRRALVRRPARGHRRARSRRTTTSSSGGPSLEGGACGVGPSCADIWFRELGFVTLAFMALCGFVAILVLVVPRPPSDQETT